VDLVRADQKMCHRKLDIEIDDCSLLLVRLAASLERLGVRALDEKGVCGWVCSLLCNELRKGFGICRELGIVGRDGLIARYGGLRNRGNDMVTEMVSRKSIAMTAGHTRWNVLFEVLHLGYRDKTEGLPRDTRRARQRKTWKPHHRGRVDRDRRAVPLQSRTTTL